MGVERKKSCTSERQAKQTMDQLEDVFRDEVSRTVAKTEDELKKYTLDPDLGQVARLHSLLQGNDVQKSVAGGALATLDPLNEPDAIGLIKALTIAQTSSGESRQVQQDMGPGVIELINGTESLTTAIKDALTVLILVGVDSTNGQYWGMTLSTLLERLTYAEVQGKLGEIGSRSAMTTSEVGRTAITLTLGTLMKSLEGKPEQNDILQLTKELSNDVCLDVRQAASSQMDTIVCSLDKSSIPEILTEVNCLICEDEEAVVVEVALQTLPKTISACSAKSCNVEILALMKDILNHDFLCRLPESARLLALVFDQICGALYEHIDTFIQLARSSCPQTTGAAIQATRTIHSIIQYCHERHVNLAESVDAEFKETIGDFFKRDELHIQNQAAQHFIDIAQVLPRKQAQRHYVDLWKSLTPASTGVMETLAIESRRIKCTRCHHASSTSVTTFSSADSTNGSASSMCGAPEPEFVLSGALGGELSHHITEFVTAHVPLQRWRVLFYPLKTALNLQLPLTPLVPLVKMLVKESPYKPVRFISAEILVNHMRSAPVIEHREIYKFITDLMSSEQCRDRVCFIKLVPILVEIFSKKFFKKHFYDKVLQLSNDRVPNVRYQVCRLLPLIKPMLTLPDDREKLNSLDLTLRNIISFESDRDVRKIIEDVIITMDRIPVRMIRANNNHIDTVEREKEEHEKQYEEKKADPRSTLGRRTSSSSSVGSNATTESLIDNQRKQLRSRVESRPGR